MLRVPESELSPAPGRGTSGGRPRQWLVPGQAGISQKWRVGLIGPLQKVLRWWPKVRNLEEKYVLLEG